MNIQTGVPRPSTQAEDFLEDLVEDLQVPVSRIEQAERSYKSLGAWLHRPNSTVRDLDPNVYVQGSFRLGTTIRPLNDQEEYDIDSVCEFGRVGKGSLSQAELKRRLGVEVEAYRRSQNMSKPMREGRRCWVLDYADGAQFHMDIVPAVPNGRDTRLLLEARQMDPRWGATAIGITDNEVWNYQIISDDWPRSNPKGYADWFRSRMAVAFARRRQRLAESARASVEDIPDYKVRTPLQAAVMLLKRHRDMMFVDRYSSGRDARARGDPGPARDPCGGSGRIDGRRRRSGVPHQRADLPDLPPWKRRGQQRPPRQHPSRRRHAGGRHGSLHRDAEIRQFQSWQPHRLPSRRDAASDARRRLRSARGCPTTGQHTGEDCPAEPRRHHPPGQPDAGRCRRRKNGRIVDQQLLLAELGERMRDVRVAPDGSIHILTDGAEGRLLRLLPIR